MEESSQSEVIRWCKSEVVSRNLQGIGALSLDEYLATVQPRSPASQVLKDNTSNDDILDRSIALPQSHVGATVTERDATDSVKIEEVDTAVAQLDDAPNMDGESPLKAIYEDDFVKRIEQCCAEWRAGRVKPYWLIVSASKFGLAQGCALRIQLSTRSFKVYSVATKYETPTAAGQACAKLAIDAGVLDYIRHGDGQMNPAVKMDLDQECFTGEPILPALANIQPWTVQDFFEALPRPFSEPVGNKTASEINSPAWLNTSIQGARGSRLVSNFIWTVDPHSGLHGALLRLERPGQSQSYLVASRFSRRNDAKAAVCLAAMAEGAGHYIRGAAREVVERLTPAIRKSVNDVLLPTIHQEYHKIRSGAVPMFQYVTELDSIGCTMTLQLVPQPTPEQHRQYTVPPDYRNRADARAAVIVLAVEQGVVEFLRFRGQHIPRDYVRYYLQPTESLDGRIGKKRSHADDSEGGRRKMPRLNNGMQGNRRGQNFHFGQPRSQGPSWSNQVAFPAGNHNGLWMAPYAPNNGGAQPSAPSHSGYDTSQAPFGSGPPVAHVGPPIPLTSPIHSGGDLVAYYASLAANSLPTLHHTNSSNTTAHAAGTAYSQYVAPPTSSPAIPGGAAYTSYPNASYTQPFQLCGSAQQQQAYTPYAVAPPIMYPTVAQMGPVGTSGISSFAAPIGAWNTTAVPMQGVQPSSTSNSVSHPPQNGSPNDTQMENPLQRARTAPTAPNRAGFKKIQVQSAPKSSVTELYDYCMKENLPSPQFCSEVVHEQGESKHKIWVVIGKQKLELPTTFTSLSQGQERVAKKVLEQLRSQSREGAK